MKKKDRRTLYTENVIKETILKLLQTKPISKITVSEVCKIAEINRGTFYIHYKDCLDVLEQLQEEYCNDVIRFIEEQEEEDHLDIILKLHEYNKAHENHYLIFMRTDLPVRSFKKLIDFGKNKIIEDICDNSSLTPTEADWIAFYMVSASSSITQKYGYEDEYTKHREMLLQQFINGGLSAIAELNPPKKQKKRAQNL